MRILIIGAAVDRSEARLFAGLAGQGFDIKLWTSPNADLESLRALGLDPQPIEIRHRLQRDAIAFFREKVRTDPPDLIYASLNAPLSVALQATKGSSIPVVGYRGTMGHVSRWNPGSWLTYLHPRVARIVCVSEAVRQYLLTFRLPPERLVTIYKGHDLEWYAHPPAIDRSSFKVDPDAFLLGFAGNIRPVKGVDYLLKALTLLPESSPVRLLLVGDNRNARVANLLQQPAIKRRVRVLGFREDAWAIMGQCDAVIMPSVEREGLPRALIEAMAQRVPALVTDVGGMPELVRDGLEGRVFPPRSAQAIAEAVQYMVDQPAIRRKMGEAARLRVEEAFNIRTTIEQYAELFHSLVKKNA